LKKEIQQACILKRKCRKTCADKIAMKVKGVNGIKMLWKRKGGGRIGMGGKLSASSEWSEGPREGGGK
jgi:hypothetical protein